jgi:hypothetical protein
MGSSRGDLSRRGRALQGRNCYTAAASAKQIQSTRCFKTTVHNRQIRESCFTTDKLRPTNGLHGSELANISKHLPQLGSRHYLTNKLI